MANTNLGIDRDTKLKAIASQNGISVSHLMRKLVDSFFNNPSLFLNEFTFKSEINTEK